MAFIEILMMLIIIIIILMLFSQGMIIIQPHERGFVYRGGKFTCSLNPGFVWVYPFISQVTRIDTRKEGLVTTKVGGLLSSGRVKVGDTEWSACSNGKKIPVGRTVRVVGTDGEQIIVEEVV